MPDIIRKNEVKHSIKCQYRAIRVIKFDHNILVVFLFFFIDSSFIYFKCQYKLMNSKFPALPFFPSFVYIVPMFTFPNKSLSFKINLIYLFRILNKSRRRFIGNRGQCEIYLYGSKKGTQNNTLKC